MEDGKVAKSLNFRRLAQRIRVTSGFLIIPLLFIAARPTVNSLLVGAVVSLTGLLIRAWASGYLKKNQELTVTGPYAFTRNPLYLGTFIMATGVALTTNSWWFIAVFLALYLLIYVPVMMAEAETLNKLFPAEYASYSERVPMFLPRLLPYREAKEKREKGRRFALSQYLRHREYRAALGMAIIYILLTARMVYLK
jgi:protein-S-isoprenylcysteine O-methyltransferase Ste14